MADVFISYARAERADAEQIKRRLEGLGLSVFLDVEGLDGGDVFSAKLDHEVKTAGCVLGLWTPLSLSRPWVQIECDIGRERGVLVPAMTQTYPRMAVPAPFWNIQHVDLTQLSERADDAGWLALVRALARTLNRPQLLAAEARGAGHSAEVRDELKEEVERLHGELAAIKSVMIARDARTQLGAVSESGAAAATGPRPPTTLRVGLEHCLSGHTRPVLSAVFSADGKKVLTASRDHTARVWDAATGEVLITLTGHNDVVWSAKFSPNGSRIVTGSQDDAARMWDSKTGQCLLTFKQHWRTINCVDFSPDGLAVITASNDHSARLWNAETGQSIAAFADQGAPVISARFSRDGQQIVTTANRTANIWNARSFDKVGSLVNALPPGYILPINTRAAVNFAFDASFSPDRTLVVVACSHNEARLWRVSTGEMVQSLSGHSERLRSADFSPDGALIVTASEDNTARIWDAATGRNVATLAGHRGGVSSAAFAPDSSRVVTSAGDNIVRIWRIEP
jgi:WD40 repeat protein